MNEKELKKEVKKKLEDELNGKEIHTKSYEEFRQDVKERPLDTYEKICRFCEKIIKFSPNPKQREKISESIETAHLQVTPEGVYTAAYLIPMVLLFISVFFFLIVPVLFGNPIPLFFFAVSVIISLLLIIPLMKYPGYAASAWRLKSTNQMVVGVFYIVTYMRQSPNLERAIEFASKHLDPPLALDFKKILWNVENHVYDTLNDSLDNYLQGWKEYSEEFIDSIHLIQSSLLEGSETRRLELLDKSLDVMLNGTFEKMLHYAQNLKGPITALHMLGIILPVMGLVILPLAVSFIEGVEWFHLAVFYNIILPVMVYLLSKNILATRPSGYGDSDISENHPLLQKKKNPFGIPFSAKAISITVFFILFFIGSLPVLMTAAKVDDVCWDFGNPGLFCEDVTQEECRITFCAWGYTHEETAAPVIFPDTLDSSNQKKLMAPFGIIASLLSIFITLAFGISIGMYYKMRSGKVIQVRNDTKQLEKEFSTALFQLGNRMGDGQPAEVAIPKVAELMSDTKSGHFFSKVTINMQKLGMGLHEAIFDKKQGAINLFPSKTIESSMKILVESSQKGPKIAAQALNNIARYMKEIHRVNERLKDLLSDIISSMKQQINFLAPVISGVVVGITSMITFILGKLGAQTAAISAGAEAASFEFLQIGTGIPTYYFQGVVGLYVVELVFILTIMSNAIENGQDKLGEKYMLGKNLVKTTLLYAAITLGVVLIFQLMAGSIIARTGVV